MTRSDAERVHDILDACNKLVEVAALGRAEFGRSWILQSAAERQLEIIGDAMSGLSEEFFGDAINLPLRQAKGLRNVISHEYFRVNRDRIWNVVGNRIPQLVSALAGYNEQDSGA